MTHSHVSLEDIETVGIIQFTFLVALTLSVIGGNYMVITAFFRYRSLLKDYENRYVLSLAITDLLIGCTLMPASAASGLFNSIFPLGNLICVICVYLSIYILTVMTVHLVLISYNRYQVVCNPLKYRSWMTHKKAHCLLAVVWVIPFVFVLLPALILFQYDLFLEDHHHNETLFIDTGHCSPGFSLILKLIMFFISFILPLVILLICYFGVVRYIHGQPAMLAANKEHNRVVKRGRWLVVAIIVNFIVAWVPCFAIMFVTEVVDISDGWLSRAVWVVYLSIVVHPLLSCYTKPKFKRALLRKLPHNASRSQYNAEYSRSKSNTYFQTGLKRNESIGVASYYHSYSIPTNSEFIKSMRKYSKSY